MPLSPGDHAWSGCEPDLADRRTEVADAPSPVSVQAFVTSAGPSDGSDSSQTELAMLQSLRLHNQTEDTPENEASEQDQGEGPMCRPCLKTPDEDPSPPFKKKPPFTVKLQRCLTPDLARPPSHKRRGSLDSLLLPPHFTQSQADSALHRKKSSLNPQLVRSSSLATESQRFGESVSPEHVYQRRPESGFSRPELGSKPLVGSVKMHERMVFLCYKEPASWPPRIEAAEAERLPKRLASAIYMKRKVFTKKTKFALCEGRDGSECDVLIFPDMKRYCAMTHFDIDHLIEEALLTGREKVLRSQPLTGCHVFICAHASRDARCGACGPPLVAAFEAVAKSKGLEDSVHVRACSHIGGHAFAGNVIIYMERDGKVAGDWYGYVTPRDVPLLMEQHIQGGQIVDHLWRGAMGLTAEEQEAELSRIRSLQNAEESAQREGSKCEDCSFLPREEIEDLVATGVCAPHEQTKDNQAAVRKQCCSRKVSSDAQVTELPSQRSWFSGGFDSSLIASAKAHLKRLHTEIIPEWVRRFDGTDTALCGALVVSGIALYIAIDLHRGRR